jgi:hypothetical protein
MNRFKYYKIPMKELKNFQAVIKISLYQILNSEKTNCRFPACGNFPLYTCEWKLKIIKK